MKIVPPGKTAEAVPAPDAGAGQPLSRITVNLIPLAYAAQERLMQRTGLSKTGTVNRALQVYDFLEAVTSRGGEILIREAGSEDVQRVIFT